MIDHSSSTPPFSVFTQGSEQVLVLQGTLTLEHIRCLHETAMRLSRDAASVVVDCAAAEHLDACTLQIFLALKTELERGGHAFRIARENAEVRRYLELAGLATHFPEGISQP